MKGPKERTEATDQRRVCRALKDTRDRAKEPRLWRKDQRLYRRELLCVGAALELMERALCAHQELIEKRFSFLWSPSRVIPSVFAVCVLFPS